jgi:Transposase DDE domain group 1
MASAQMTGADFLVGMDRRRANTAGQRLEPVPTPASTTTAQVAKRFTATHLAGIGDGIGVVNARVLALVSPRRRTQLLAAATIDGDTTDVEVYGRDKQDAVYNYQEQRAYRPHIAFWAEGGVTLSADLMKADEDPRPVAAELLDRAIAQLPPGVAKIRCRWEAGYFAADLAKHCIDRGVEFAIGVKRNSAVVRASREAPAAGWHPAKDMPHTEVAVIDYLPGKWPEGAGVTCIARRTRIRAAGGMPAPLAVPIADGAAFLGVAAQVQHLAVRVRRHVGNAADPPAGNQTAAPPQGRERHRSSFA